MEQEELGKIMIALAIATPIVGALMLLADRSMARDAGEPAMPIMRRSGLILLAAGPLNLLVWLMFNRWLDAVGYRSVAGYALAAAVFLGVGWATGFFSRMGGRRRIAIPREKPGDKDDGPSSTDHSAPSSR